MERTDAVGARTPRLDGVGKVYGRAGRPDVVLRDCSFELEPHKLTVLIGPSGCGKSTIVNLLAGHARPSVGSVRMGDAEIRGPGADRMLVFQETALFPWMSLTENVAFGPTQAGTPKTEAQATANALLRKVGLAGFEDRYPSQISGGMQRRAEVARALIGKPDLLLLDEPFRGLDHMSRGLMQEYFGALFEEHRTTTLFVTSEVDEAIFLADRIIVLSYKPTQVKEIVEVQIPRPRDVHLFTSTQYGDLKERVLNLLYAEAVKAFGQGATAAQDIERALALVGVSDA